MLSDHPLRLFFLNAFNKTKYVISAFTYRVQENTIFVFSLIFKKHLSHLYLTFYVNLFLSKANYREINIINVFHERELLSVTTEAVLGNEDSK